MQCKFSSSENAEVSLTSKGGTNGSVYDKVTEHPLDLLFCADKNMNLYLTMDLDNIQNDDYQAMLHEMVYLSTQAIDWKRSSVLADHGTDSALRNLLNSLSAKVQSLDMDSLMKYAAVLSESTKNLDEGGILQGLINAKAQ